WPKRRPAGRIGALSWISARTSDRTDLPITAPCSTPSRLTPCRRDERPARRERVSAIARPVVQVSGCRKTYGPTVAVDDVSFEVFEGEIFGLIGPNGAGKTTTMECVEGLRVPDRGRISVLGRDPFRDVYALQERIGVQLQQAQLQKRIKVWEA